MKRLPILLIALLLFTSCTTHLMETPDNPNPNETPSNTLPIEPSQNLDVNDEYEDYFTYPLSGDYVNFFAVDENGNVYITDLITEYDPVTTYDLLIAVLISAYDLNGELSATYEIPLARVPTHMCVGDGVIYFSTYVEWEDREDWNSYAEEFFSFDLQTQELKRLDAPSEFFYMSYAVSRMNPNYQISAVKKLSYQNGKLYILAIHEDYIGIDYELREEDIWGSGENTFYNFEYEGRVLAAYDLKNESLEIVFDDLLQDFSPTPGGLLMLQAYDNIGGVYFAEFDPKTMTSGERIYREIGRPATFATDGYGVMFSVDAGGGLINPGNLYYWPLGEDTGVSELAKAPGLGGLGLDSRNPDSVAYCGGFTYYINYSGSINTGVVNNTLERIKNSAYINYTPPVQIVGANMYSELPREGYNIAFDMLAYDEFALAVLSGGTSYDIAYVGTRQDFATNIRDKGSFYPLNDVPGVQEYLDACFPYVKDAATDKNGDIWMLPISINAEAIIYQPENCKKAGIDFAGAKTVQDIIDNVKRAQTYDTTGLNYFFNKTALLQKSMARYIRGNESLDTAEFRTAAEALKGFMTGASSLGGDGFTVVANPDYNEDFLFANSISQTSSHLTGRDDLYIVPVTGTDGQSSADCVFLCVNPASDKLERTLTYISAVCESLMTKNNALMLPGCPAFSGSEYAKRLYTLYENSIIDFNISDEVFAIDFDRYLQGEIDIDTMITEADRKLAMYRGE